MVGVVGVAGAYGVGQVLGGVGASASGCLCPGVVGRGRRVRGQPGPWLGWGQRFRLPAPGCRLAGVHGVGRVPGWDGASASGCLCPGVVGRGRRVRCRPGPWLGWGQRLRLPAPGCRLGLPACPWLAGSLVGVGPALRVACAWVPLGGAGVYGVGRVPGWYGTGASGCLRPGAVWWGRRVRGWQGPGLVWGQRFRLPAPGCRLVGPACTGSVVSLAGVGASASGCLRPGPVWGGRRVRGRRGPWLGWGQRFRVPAPGCRLAVPASTWSAGSPVGVGPVPSVACARVSPRVPGVYGVSRVPGRRGASASGCLRQGVVRRGRRVRG